MARTLYIAEINGDTGFQHVTLRIYDNKFIPIVWIDTDQIGKKPKKDSLNWTYDGFKIYDLGCLPKTKINDVVSIVKGKQKLYGIKFESKDEIVVKFLIKKGVENPHGNEGKIIIKTNNVTVKTKNEILTEYGHSIALRILSKNLNNDSYIDFYANDENNNDEEDEIHCGRVKIVTESTEKDVFTQTDIDRLYKDNEQSKIFNRSGQVVGNGYCICAADKGIGALVNDTKNFYSEPNLKSQGGNGIRLESSTKRANVINSLGYIKSNFSINTDNYNTSNAPTKFITSLKSKIEKDIEEKNGFHVYYFSMHGEYHVMLLVVDNRNPCDIKYSILDQGYVGEKNLDFENLDSKFIELAKRFWRNKNQNAKITYMWKIQNKS